jgi:thiamine-monophosphate kinase
VAPPKPPEGLQVGPTSAEDAFIQHIRAALAARLGDAPEGEVWIGDDAAVLSWGPGPLLLTTDSVVAGVHADLDLVGLDDLGWKALSVAVSDIAAMGGRPRHAVVAIGVPAGSAPGPLIEGLLDAAAAWHCPIVGGDLSGAPVVLVAVAVTGALEEGSAPAVRRSGASTGDHLFVTGALGSSAAGLRRLRSAEAATRGEFADDPLVRAHRRPRARVDEGWTARRAGASAMMDVSDGLSIDLHRLADASGVGFALPLAEGATLAEALGGGEDYELIIATPDAPALEAAFAGADLPAPQRIGTVTADPGQRVLGDQPLARLGWEHRIG